MDNIQRLKCKNSSYNKFIKPLFLSSINQLRIVVVFHFIKTQSNISTTLYKMNIRLESWISFISSFKLQKVLINPRYAKFSKMITSDFNLAPMWENSQFIYSKLNYYQKYITKHFKKSMSQYDAFFQNKSHQECNQYLENLDELFFDHPKYLDLNYEEKKDQHLDPTNFVEKQPTTILTLHRTLNLIDVSKHTINSYIHAKKGSPSQTMELLPNFKTFIVRKIKDLLLIRVLNREQTSNCLAFIRNKPSFESLNSLLSPAEKCKSLQSALLEYFSSSQIICDIMQSGIRVQQKKMLIKFTNRMQEQLANPGKSFKWKQYYY